MSIMSTDPKAQGTLVQSSRDTSAVENDPVLPSTPEDFQHQPLDLSTGEFRLVQKNRLGPKRELCSPSINLEMRHFHFNDAPVYTAVSYTWGDPTITRRIHVNGRPFHIRSNLWHFLQAKPYTGKWYWIDALCIDQSNVRERNHQISLMSNIYSAALGVVAWIGRAADGSDEVFRFVKARHMAEWLSLPARGSRLDIALAAIWERPYWHRLWIVQEFILAQKLFIQCGGSITSWIAFSSFIFFQAEFAERSTIPPLHIYALFSERKWRFGLRRDLSRLIDVFGTFESEDIRDKVYAVLGIAESHGIVVDYNKSVLDIYLEILGSVAASEVEQPVMNHLLFSEKLRRYLKLDWIEEGLMEKFLGKNIKKGIEEDRIRRHENWKREEVLVSASMIFLLLYANLSSRLPYGRFARNYIKTYQITIKHRFGIGLNNGMEKQNHVRGVNNCLELTIV